MTISATTGSYTATSKTCAASSAQIISGRSEGWDTALTRLKSSLTLRIFWITCLLLIAACGITYGAIAYLTPISYTSLLADELSRESAALMERLSGRTKAECTALLQDFARQTGADMRLVDEYGNVLYDTIPEAVSYTHLDVYKRQAGERQAHSVAGDHPLDGRKDTRIIRFAGGNRKICPGGLSAVWHFRSDS